jgi:putative ABC transport system permease protein
MNRPVVKYEEYEAIKLKSQKTEEVCFIAFTQKTVKYKNNNIENIEIWGASPELEALREIEIINGRFLTLFEFQTGRNMAVIGSTIAEKLFENKNPVGELIKVMGHKAMVIGVAKKEGKNMFGGGSLDEIIVVPVFFLRNMIDIRSEQAYPMIWAKTGRNVTNDELKDDLRRILRSERRLKPMADDNFALNETSMITGPLGKVFKVINMAGLFIGIFSILVGGFGIANIMFVSVKERTNIIGIQKALGAKRYFILSQFLFESVILALSGGIIGLLLVFALTAAMTGLLNNFIVTLTPGNIVLGLTVSAIIGIISGFAPAYSAARMDPVTAINTTF